MRIRPKVYQLKNTFLRSFHSKTIAKMNQEDITRQELINFLEKESKEFFNIIKKDAIYPHPFPISQSENEIFTKIHQALNSAIKITVHNYYTDNRIKQIYNFPLRIQSILDKYRDIPFNNIGAYRPDFLHSDKDNSIRICEINARFPTNGYLITNFGNNFYQNKSSNSILNCFKNEFDNSKPIGILKNREKGYDINILKEFFNNVHYINPKDLYFDTKLSFKNVNFDQFILELHQDEILSLSDQILFYMIKSCKLLNDLRTIFLIHDKRFLNILSRDDILFDYLSLDNIKIIREHRLRTYLTSQLKWDINLKRDILENRKNWLIKPALLG
ncbi:unnamed protein product, partial [Brachionus calyciflorus]